MLPIMLNAWQANALEHSWVMPDGFEVVVKVMDKKEARIEIDELDHATFTVNYKVNEGSKTGISIPANLTHSADAYLLRNMIRRCNYNKSKVTKILDALETAVEENRFNKITENVNLKRAINLFTRYNIVDTCILDYLTVSNVDRLPLHIQVKLINLLTKMLETPPFPIITIHDAFRCHPNNGNTMRYWYKEIMAEIAESNMMAEILSQITRSPVQVNKLSKQLGTKIRNSNLSIC